MSESRFWYSLQFLTFLFAYFGITLLASTLPV